MEKKLADTPKSRERVVDMVETALMAALILVGAYVIHIPSPNNGTVHLGDSLVLLSAVVLGKRNAVLASAIGMTLFDVIGGYYYWAPFTFIIKAIMAYVAATIIAKDKFNIKRQTIGFTLASLWMVIGYFVAGAFVEILLSEGALTLSQGLIISAAAVMPNVVQGISAIIIAIPLVIALRKSSFFNNRNQKIS